MLIIIKFNYIMFIICVWNMLKLQGTSGAHALAQDPTARPDGIHFIQAFS
jgi:hypothetical protein